MASPNGPTGTVEERPDPGPSPASDPSRDRADRPDSLRERLGANPTVLALSVARLGDGVGNSLLLVALPLYVVEVGVGLDLPSSVAVGILVSLFGLANVFAQPLGAVLVDRFGHRKRWIEAGLVVMGVGTVAFLFADSYASLLGIRAFQALGFALTLPASMALITATTHRLNRGGAMGVFATFRMLGFAVGPLLAGWLHVTYGFDAVFGVGAVTILAGVVCVEAWVEEPETAPAPGGRFAFFDRELLTRGIVVLGVATFAMATAISMMTTLENEFNERLQQTALGFGLAFSSLTATRLLVQVPLGSLSDRIGRRPIIVVGLLLLAPATALLGWVGSTLELTLARLLQGVATAAVAAPAFALAGDLSTEGGVGRQLSVLTAGFAAGIGVGPLLAGVLAVVSFELPFAVGGVLCLGAAVLVQRIVPETVGEDRDAEEDRDVELV